MAVSVTAFVSFHTSPFLSEGALFLGTFRWNFREADVTLAGLHSHCLARWVPVMPSSCLSVFPCDTLRLLSRIYLSTQISRKIFIHFLLVLVSPGLSSSNTSRPLWQFYHKTGWLKTKEMFYRIGLGTESSKLNWWQRLAPSILSRKPSLPFPVPGGPSQLQTLPVASRGCFHCVFRGPSCLFTYSYKDISHMSLGSTLTTWL